MINMQKQADKILLNWQYYSKVNQTSAKISILNASGLNLCNLNG